MTEVKLNPLHWEDLNNCTTKEILKRKAARVPADGSAYEVTFMGSVYSVNPTEQTVKEVLPGGAKDDVREELQILLIRYLVVPYGGEPSGKEVGPKELPGGATFFDGPRALHVAPVEQLYGEDLEGFEARGLEIGGVVVQHGDKAIRLLPFPEIPVTYVLWAADGDLPAAVSVLFDYSIHKWFTHDMIHALVLVLNTLIAPEWYNGVSQ